jgi:hypothetical protein
MNKELWMVGIPAVGWLLFALGGTKISDSMGGKKWLRRFVLTFILGVCVFFAGFQWWQGLAVFAISCLFFHLGYGDKAKWPMKCLIFSGYGLISAPIGLSWWNLITAVGCVLMMLFSNIPGLSKTFVWKIVEGFFGAVIGVQIAFLLSGNGLIWKF